MKITFLLLFVLLSIPCWGQVRTITGRVINIEDRAPVRNAWVMVKGSTSGTLTNHLGYFQIRLAQNYNELVISRIGYATGKILIPQVDRFDIELSPKNILLKQLDLTTFPKQSQLSDTGPQKVEWRPHAQNAVYTGGWELFYQKLGNEIANHKNFSREPFGTDLEFIINRDGKVAGIEVLADSGVNKEIILHSVLQLNDWKPAIQNGVPVSQVFSLRISFGELTTHAHPRGGTIEDFYHYIRTHINYPFEAWRNSIAGSVSVRGIIGKDGTLNKVEVINGIGYGGDELITGLFKDFSEWTPAYYKGRAVEQSIIIPVKFEIRQMERRKRVLTLAEQRVLMESIADSLYQKSKVPQDKFSELVFPKIIVITHKAWKYGDNKAGNEDLVIPRFSNDNNGLEKYIERNRAVTKPVPPNNSDNIVTLEFTVDAKGNVKDVVVTEGLGEPFDSEAVRLYTQMPKWIPGKDNGKPVEMKSLRAAVDFGNIPDYKILAASASFRWGLQFYNEGKLEKALQQFTKAIEKNPTVLDYYFNKAITLIDMDKSPCETLKKIKDYDQATLDLYYEHCKGH